MKDTGCKDNTLSGFQLSHMSQSELILSLSCCFPRFIFFPLPFIQWGESLFLAIHFCRSLLNKSGCFGLSPTYKTGPLPSLPVTHTLGPHLWSDCSLTQFRLPGPSLCFFPPHLKYQVFHSNAALSCVPVPSTLCLLSAFPSLRKLPLDSGWSCFPSIQTFLFSWFSEPT